jgi:anti-anti-sigma factor
MPSDYLDFNVRHPLNINGAALSNDVAIIDLRGELSAFAGEALDKAFAQVRQQNSSIILLNFGGVSYINSTGIALIIGLVMQATKAGLRLIACGLTNHYVKIFQIARLSEYISMFPDEASALSSVRENGFQMRVHNC